MTKKIDTENSYNGILNNTKTALNIETIELIKKDAILYGKVAESLGVTPLSFVKYLYRPNSKLIQINVLDIIVGHLKVQDTAA